MSGNQLLFLILAVTIILHVVGFFWIRRVEKRIAVFFRNKQGEDFGELVRTLHETVIDAGRSVEAIETHVGTLDKRLARSIQKVHMIRFNPFKDNGGDQSFAIALLDQKGNGVVVSSIYSREGVRVYAKPINEGTSTYQLSEEEANVVTQALAQK